MSSRRSRPPRLSVLEPGRRRRAARRLTPAAALAVAVVVVAVAVAAVLTFG